MDRVEYESLIIQDLVGYHERDELDLSPWYQPRSVWSRPQKAYLINTIHENKPVPSIYIRHTVDLEKETSIKEFVDGQQRVRCVIEYRNDEFPAKHPKHLTSVLFSGLSKRERVHFLQSSLSVGYLIGATDADVIEIFARINTISKTLNPQERRNANFSGAFKQFCLQEAITRLPFWRRNRIFTDSQISRMTEVQFVSDVVINLVEGLQDFAAKKLDGFYRKYDEDFPRAVEIQERLDRIYTIMLEMPDGLIRGSIFSTPQLLFSLMLVLDAKKRRAAKVVRRGISELDAIVEAVRSGENPGALKADVYDAFTSGNLHRIRSRQTRDEVIRSYI